MKKVSDRKVFKRDIGSSIWGHETGGLNWKEPVNQERRAEDARRSNHQ